MSDIEEVWNLEKAGWRAASGGDGYAFYSEVLAPDSVMIFPGIMLSEEQELLDSITAQPWNEFRMENKRAVQEGGVVVLTYRGSGCRAEQPEYNAFISSVYVRRGGDWKLLLHTQTPA